jgi:hypothetical protein
MKATRQTVIPQLNLSINTTRPQYSNAAQLKRGIAVVVLTPVSPTPA